jgi:hypothetical protein
VEAKYKSSFLSGFWAYLTTCVLRGHSTAAISMLQKLPRYAEPSKRSTTRRSPSSDSKTNSTNPVSQLSRLLSTMPKPSTHASQQDFETRWLKWKDSATFLCDTSYLSTLISSKTDLPHFQTLFGIVAGDVDTITKASSSWTEAVVALTVYSYPYTSVSELSNILTASVLSSSENPPSVLDEVLQSIMEGDLDRAVRLCMTIDGW